MPSESNATYEIAAITINSGAAGNPVVAASGIAQVEDRGGGQYGVTLNVATSDAEVFVTLGIGTAAGQSVRRETDTRWLVQHGDPGVGYVVWHRVSPGANGLPSVAVPPPE